MDSKQALKISRLILLYLGTLVLYTLIPVSFGAARTMLSGLLAIMLAAIFVIGLLRLSRS